MATQGMAGAHHLIAGMSRAFLSLAIPALAILTDVRYAFAAGVAPFVVADIVKVAIGAALLPKAQQLVAKI